MKKGYIYSAILGGAFFAVPYWALELSLWPSIAFGVLAYGAGVYMMNGKRKESNLSIRNENMYDILNAAKEKTIKINNISSKIEDKEVVKNINEICDISNKIINTLSKKPEKLRQAHNFLNYYLPVTIKILERYDEIENQKLNTFESKKFMNSVEKMIIKIKNAFSEQLNNMYQTEMIDTDAEIKVFEGMLKSDGFIDEISIDVDDKGGAKSEK